MLYPTLYNIVPELPFREECVTALGPWGALRRRCVTAPWNAGWSRCLGGKACLREGCGVRVCELYDHDVLPLIDSVGQLLFGVDDLLALGS